MSDAVPPLIDEPNALPAGTRFGELEILRVLGVGGFGIVYLALDHALERQVAIKEYMPSQLAQRQQSTTVVVRSAQAVETFDLGLRSFVNEARMLACFDHPSLLKVYRFWEANGTAYMVMPYLLGKTLKQVREASGDAPGEAWIMKRVLPLIDALELLHAEQVYHRDIAPDNILLPSDGADPILLDFGAARRVIGDRTQSLTAIFKPSYAPIEQYGETTQLRQGAWTDVYSLGAVLHYLLVGAPPPLATTRAVIDEMVPLSQRRDWPTHSRHFRAAIDWALSVRPSMRPQSMTELREALMGDRTLPVIRPNAAPAADKSPDAPAAPPSAAPPADLGYEFTQILPAQVALPAAHAVTQPLGQEPLPAGGPPPGPSPAPVPAVARESAVRVEPIPAARIPAPSPVAAPSEPEANGTPKAWWWGAALLGLLLLSSFWWVLVSRPPGPAGAESAELTNANAASAPATAGVQTAESSTPPAGPVAVTPPMAQTGAEAIVAGAAGKPVPTEIVAPKAVATTELAASKPTSVKSPRLAKPEPAAVQPAAAQPTAHAEPESTAAGGEDPRAACGDRVFIALWRCIERNCEEPRYREHAECVSLRERRERRERR